MDNDNGLLTFSHGDITLWVANGASIHIKAVTGHGDPVELTSEQAQELGEKLLQLARDID